MATAPEQNEPPVEELENELPEAQQDGEPEGEEYDPENDPYAPLASRMGWTPKEKFRGDPEKWKPAEDWILDGYRIQTHTAKELREIKSTVDAMSRTTASIVEDKLAQQRAELINAHQTAVEDGDPEAAFRISQDIARLGQQAAQPVGSDPVATWAAENKWYKSDPLATDLAFQTCNRLAAQGFSVQQQLEAATKAVEREFPELFPDRAPAPRAPTPPAVRGPTIRTAAPSNRQKGFRDMPKAAQDIAKGMADRKVIGSVDEYATRYWQMTGSKA